MRLSSIPQRIEYNARLNSCEPAIGINLEDLVHVFRKIQHDGYIAALPRQACPSSTRQDGRLVLFAGGSGCDHVIRIARDDQADRNLAVVGSVGGIQSAAPAIEPNLPAYRAPQFILEIGCPGEAIDRLGVGTERQWSVAIQEILDPIRSRRTIGSVARARECNPFVGSVEMFAGLMS